MMNVAQYVADFLVQQKVRHVFGLQGGAILKLVDAMVATGKIDYVQNFHEQASAFCADGYARVTGNLGVALATSGPGATNLVTGIANAQLDSIPTLFITGQEYSTRLAKQEGVRSNGFQDLDIVSVVKPLTKYAAVVTDPSRIAYELEKALYLAQSGRPGAVLLDIPIDVQFKEIDEHSLQHFAPEAMAASPIVAQQISEFVTLLQGAKRPVILGGGGIRLAHAREEFAAFAKAANIPVALTLNGLDAYDDAIGFSGLYGNVPAALAVYHADLLIVLGARLGQHQVGKTKDAYTQARIVHVDIDALELGRTMGEDLSIQADLKPFLQQASQAIAAVKLPDFSNWQAKIASWQQRYAGEPGDGVSPGALVREAQQFYGRDTVVVADVGQNQMWVAQASRLTGEQRLLNSSGLGSMGYALPAAIAAKLVRPDASVVAYMGDGGFQINLQELQLVMLKGLDLKMFVFNNGTLGLIKVTQDKYYEARRYGCAAPDFACVDLENIARAYKLRYLKISAASEMSTVVKEAMQTPGVCLVEVVIDPEFPLRTRHEMADIFAQETQDA